MTKSLVLWAVCEMNGGGWKPVLGTIATTRRTAIDLYEWGLCKPIGWPGALEMPPEYTDLRRAGKARAMRVEVRPIEPSMGEC